MKPCITLMKNDEEMETRLTIKETCKFLDTDRQNIYNAIKHGWKCNGYIVFDEARQLNEMLDRVKHDQLPELAEFLDELVN